MKNLLFLTAVTLVSITFGNQTDAKNKTVTPTIPEKAVKADTVPKANVATAAAPKKTVTVAPKAKPVPKAKVKDVSKAPASKKENADKPNTKSEDRIIGGEVVEGGDRPPFMAIFNFKPSSTVKCTASIVSPHWLISAAHCLVKKKEFEKSPCLEGIGLGFKSVCSRSPDGDIVVTFPAQEAEVPQIFIDVDDMMQIKPGYVKNKRSVEKIIMSKKAYLGGMYGSYGGYDFIIIKVSEPMPGELAACLPGLQYSAGQDIMIGGYGRYRRVPCETTDKGPQIYEYCKVDPTCTRETREFKEAKCKIQFEYQGKTYNKCIRDQETPSAFNEHCKKFALNTGLSDKKMQMHNINEIVLMSGNKIITKCYRKSAGRHGWCGTTKHIVTGKKEDAYKKDASVSLSEDWGVCGDTCEDEEDYHLTGKARVKQVEIMDQEWCDDRLAALRQGEEGQPGERGFQVFPQVYCVAYNESYQTKVYEFNGNAYQERPMTRNILAALGREENFYIRATGSCKGDSGGPLYEQRGQKYIVIGTTSRGTGPIGNCGGQGNPTHYARVKFHVGFMKKYIKEELCVAN